MPGFYSDSELKSDRVVHAIGTSAAPIAVAVLLGIAIHRGDEALLPAILVYSAGLLTMLGFSAAYNLARHPDRRELLRRFDHAAIFLMIAGTYTPFIANVADPAWRWGLMAAVWLIASTGIAAKLALPRRLDGFSVLVYLGLGWIAVMAPGPLLGDLATPVIVLLAVGGALYTLGVAFHLWNGLRFHNTIWHAAVVAAAGLHYSAILLGVVLVPGG
ncbi:MAG TPA: hemolysin III family protein [Stellaceae bacterium]|nr:hemolysin III family protein [Stellaceae bacterium]